MARRSYSTCQLKTKLKNKSTDIIAYCIKKLIEEELAIPVITGKKSEKDKFVGAVYTTTLESLMPDGKALQMGTSHFPRSQNFSKPFDIKYILMKIMLKLLHGRHHGVSHGD